MKILLFGEFSGLFTCLKEGLVALGHDVFLYRMVMDIKIILLISGMIFMCLTTWGVSAPHSIIITCVYIKSY